MDLIAEFLAEKRPIFARNVAPTLNNLAAMSVIQLYLETLSSGKTHCLSCDSKAKVEPPVSQTADLPNHVLFVLCRIRIGVFFMCPKISLLGTIQNEWRVFPLLRAIICYFGLRSSF